VVIFIFLPVVLLAMSLFTGRYDLSISETISTLFSPDAAAGSPAYNIVIHIRLPRAILAVIAGGGLAVSGAALQGLFHNPLIDSGLLGVSSGAGFGAALAILLFSSMMPVYIFSFAFAVIAVILSRLIAGIYGGGSNIMLVLGGVIVSSVFASMLSFLKYTADPYDKLPKIVFWLMGSFANASHGDIITAGVPILIGTAGLVLIRWRINVLSLGERDAKSLGINIAASKFFVIGFATLAAAGSVSVCGVIGWVGLVVPHIGRMIIGNDNRYLIPLSFFAGGAFMLIGDTAGRTLTGGELPVSILTSLIGAPFYIYLLKETKGKQWKLSRSET